MSRIGNKPISLPAKVEITVATGNEIVVKGPKGTLTQVIDKDITVEVADNNLIVKRPTEQKRHKALHGLHRALLQNMVVGVSEGYKIDLELVGVGYKATTQAN